ncbi:MAG: serine/threonine protein kinase [Lentisphaeraceae bacterium]|nr:serine/threonine protein kinase [Lentisphaeraceae bacterium]
MDDFDKSLGDMPTMGDEALPIDQSIGDFPTMLEESESFIAHIDRYKFIEQIGRGAFGAVFLAKDTVSDTLVALKTLPPELNHSADDLEAVKENFKLVSKLAHPNIAQLKFLHQVEKIHDRGSSIHIEAGEYLVVMEYAEGSTLFKWIRQFSDKKVPFDKALKIARQVASALDYAHSKKIIHRDIKPGNIIISPSEEVKVLDFGLAAEVRSSMSRLSSDKGSTSGTRPYMPPEQLLGKKQDHLSDQYALAVMLYEMLSGRVPFQGVFETADMQLILAVVPKQAPEILIDLNKKQNNLLLKALSKEKAQRYPNCKEFIDTMSSGKGNSSSTKSPKKLLIVAVSTVIIISLFFLFKPSEPKSSPIVENAPVKEIPTKTSTIAEPLKPEPGTEKVLVVNNSGKIKELIGKAQQALTNDQISIASSTLAELFQLDPNNSAGLGIQKQINSKANLEKVIPVKSETDFLKKKVTGISREDGFGSQLDALEVSLNVAENYFESKSFPLALKSFSKYNLEIKQLLQKDKDRKEYKSKINKFEEALKSADLTILKKVNPNLHKEYQQLDVQRLKLISELNFAEAKTSLEACTNKLIQINNFLSSYSAFNGKKALHETAVKTFVAKLPKDKGGLTWLAHVKNEANYKEAASGNDFTTALNDMKSSLSSLQNYVNEYETYTEAKANLDKSLSSYTGPKKGQSWDDIQSNKSVSLSEVEKYNYSKAAEIVSKTLNSDVKNLISSYKRAKDAERLLALKVTELGGVSILSKGIKTWSTIEKNIEIAKQKVAEGSFEDAVKVFSDIQNILIVESKALIAILNISASNSLGQSVKADVYQGAKLLGQTPLAVNVKYLNPYNFTIKYSRHKDVKLSGSIDFFGSKKLNAKLVKDGTYLGKVESINTEWNFVVFTDSSNSLKIGQLVTINGIIFKTGRGNSGKVSLIPQVLSEISKVKVGDDIWMK